MKVYVDELPKCCLDCPCYNGEFMKCKLIHAEHSIGYFNEKELEYKDVPVNSEFEEMICPLKSIAEHDKQVRKEVVEKIREKAVYYISSVMCENCGCIQPENYIKSNGLIKLLDQIQGE